MKFQSEIVLRRGADCFSAASILEVLSANLDCGAKVVLEAVGPDAEHALDELEKLLDEFRDDQSAAEG
jgi:phosphocarrier protein